MPFYAHWYTPLVPSLSAVSTALVAATHFYNFGVSSKDGPQNPLSVLKAVAQPGDFVVFKLDIDSVDIETPIVEALLKDDEARALITDFYYELHFRTVDMEGWGMGKRMPHNLLGATAVFRELREKGLNAQMWP